MGEIARLRTRATVEPWWWVSSSIGTVQTAPKKCDRWDAQKPMSAYLCSAARAENEPTNYGPPY